jgi:hypothetical protein
MSQLEYLVALISIIVGLALTDLAQSFRELIRPGHPVRWDGLPLAWAAFAFLFTVLLWWNGFSVLKGASGEGEAGLEFLTRLLHFFLLYLCCAFALPDPDWEGSASGPEGTSSVGDSKKDDSKRKDNSRHKDNSRRGVDLEAFYFSPEHRRWFFGFLTVLFVTLGADNQITVEWSSIWSRLESAALIGMLAAASVVPIFTDRRWVHWAVVAGTLGLIGWRTVSQILL